MIFFAELVHPINTTKEHNYIFMITFALSAHADFCDTTHFFLNNATK